MTDLQQYEQRYDFHLQLAQNDKNYRFASSIDIISKKQIVCERNITADFKYLYQVRVLPMHVSNDSNRPLNAFYIRLADKYFFCLAVKQPNRLGL